MSSDEFQYDQLHAKLVSDIPELRERIDDAFGSDYDLSKESPGCYPIFEDVVRMYLFDSLDRDENSSRLVHLFDFFETMAASTDGNVTDLLRIAILEPLVYDRDRYQRARPYMGSKTSVLADIEEDLKNARD